MSNLSATSPDISPQGQHQIRLAELEKQYALARRGLAVGSRATLLGFLSGFGSLLVAAVVFVSTGQRFIQGGHLIAIFSIIAAALVVYFSFVFRRAIKLRAEIGKEKRSFELESDREID